jgi:hypothetical protein
VVVIGEEELQKRHIPQLAARFQRRTNDVLDIDGELFKWFLLFVHAECCPPGKTCFPAIALPRGWHLSERKLVYGALWVA